MKKIIIQGARLLYGFCVISLIYCIIYEIIMKNEMMAFRYSLIFLPVLLTCSLAIRYVRNFAQYFIVSALLFLGMLGLFRYLRFSVLDQGIAGVLTFAVIFIYFLSRAKKTTCYLETPGYWMLLTYFIFCIFASYVNSDFLLKFACFGAGYSYLCINIWKNQGNMTDILQDYAGLERLPVQRMKRNNNRILMGYSALVAAAMAVAPYLKIDRILYRIGRWFRFVLVWLLSFLSSGEEEQIMEEILENDPMDMVLPKVDAKPNFLLELLNKILWILADLLFYGLIAFLLFLLLRRIWQLYHQFNELPEENGDIIEDLRTVKTRKEKIERNREKRENSFFNLSPDARIRKYYKKRVQKENKEEIQSSWTPEQLEVAVDLSKEKKEIFHRYYEKARYSEEECTREEMQEMLGL